MRTCWRLQHNKSSTTAAVRESILHVFQSLRSGRRIHVVDIGQMPALARHEDEAVVAQMIISGG